MKIENIVDEIIWNQNILTKKKVTLSILMILLLVSFVSILVCMYVWTPLKNSFLNLPVEPFAYFLIIIISFIIVIYITINIKIKNNNDVIDEMLSNNKQNKRAKTFRITDTAKLKLSNQSYNRFYETVYNSINSQFRNILSIDVPRNIDMAQCKGGGMKIIKIKGYNISLCFIFEKNNEVQVLIQYHSSIENNNVMKIKKVIETAYSTTNFGISTVGLQPDEYLKNVNEMGTTIWVIYSDRKLLKHWVKRFCAFWLDVCIIYTLVTLVILYVYSPTTNIPFEALFIVFSGLVLFVYSVAFEAFNTRATIGKLVFCLKVVGIESKLNYTKIIMRNISKIHIIFLIFDWLVGLITKGDHKQKWLDRMCGTIVIETTCKMDIPSPPLYPPNAIPPNTEEEHDL